MTKQVPSHLGTMFRPTRPRTQQHTLHQHEMISARGLPPCGTLSLQRLEKSRKPSLFAVALAV